MINKELIKTIIIDSQKRSHGSLWERNLDLPTGSGKIITISGVRRSGKTYHLFRLMEKLKQSGVPNQNLVYLNFEDERMQFEVSELDLILQAFQELYPDTNLANCYFFFDEIQELPGWEKFVTRVHDSICQNIFITGSNSKLLSQEIATALRGRTLSYQVYPLSFAEFTSIQSPGLNVYSSSDRAVLSRLFNQFMKQGGFPELIRQPIEFHEKILQEYFDVMLFRDLIERYKVPNVSILKYYCKRVVGTSACEISINKIYNEVKSLGYKVGKDTLYSYQNYVESIYLGCFLNKWSTSVVKSESAQKKCYVIDQGLGAAIDYKFSQDIGRLLETTVALELIKQGKEVTYQQDAGECDFVISNKGKVENAIQVCVDISDENTKEREIRGLVQCCVSQGLQNGVLLTLDQINDIQRDGIKISVIPAWRYFYSSGPGL